MYIGVCGTLGGRRRERWVGYLCNKRIVSTKWFFNFMVELGRQIIKKKSCEVNE